MYLFFRLIYGQNEYKTENGGSDKKVEKEAFDRRTKFKWMDTKQLKVVTWLLWFSLAHELGYSDTHYVYDSQL